MEPSVKASQCCTSFEMYSTYCLIVINVSFHSARAIFASVFPCPRRMRIECP